MIFYDNKDLESDNNNSSLVLRRHVPMTTRNYAILKF